MVKAVFVGEDEDSLIFRHLGIDTKIAQGRDTFLELEEYEIIFADEAIYPRLKETYPHKAIIPLVNFKKKQYNSIILQMREIIEQTVGGEVLKNE